MLQSGNNAGEPLPPIEGLIDPHAFQICALVPDPDNGALLFHLLTVYFSMILSFNTIVFIVTLFVTVASTRTSPARQWLQVMQRDGIIYFIFIFSAVLVWFLSAIYLSDYLKLMNILPAHIFTSVMINRLYLSLREAGQNIGPRRASYAADSKSEQINGAIELQAIISRQEAGQQTGDTIER